MSGTVEGGRKACLTNKKKYGADYYVNLGRMGGRRSCNGGFSSRKVGVDGLTGPQRARLAGSKGGKISRRGPSLKTAGVNNA